MCCSLRITKEFKMTLLIWNCLWTRLEPVRHQQRYVTGSNHLAPPSTAMRRGQRDVSAQGCSLLRVPLLGHGWQRATFSVAQWLRRVWQVSLILASDTVCSFAPKFWPIHWHCILLLRLLLLETRRVGNAASIAGPIMGPVPRWLFWSYSSKWFVQNWHTTVVSADWTPLRVDAEVPSCLYRAGCAWWESSKRSARGHACHIRDDAELVVTRPVPLHYKPRRV